MTFFITEIRVFSYIKCYPKFCYEKCNISLNIDPRTKIKKGFSMVLPALCSCPILIRIRALSFFCPGTYIHQWIKAKTWMFSKFLIRFCIEQIGLKSIGLIHGVSIIRNLFRTVSTKLGFIKFWDIWAHKGRL